MHVPQRHLDSFGGLDAVHTVVGCTIGVFFELASSFRLGECICVFLFLWT